MKKNTFIVVLCALVALFSVSCADEPKPQPEPPKAVSVWDGEAVNTAWYSEEKTDFVLDEASQLAGFAKLVNEGSSFEGKTISLVVDMDLAGNPWTPIGTKTSMFSGSFDGNGKTISNLKIVEGSYVGLFGYVGDATIKGITLENAQVSGAERVGSLIGRIAGNASVSDCMADGSSNVEGSGSNTGGLVAEIAGKVNVELKNLTSSALVKNTADSNSRAAGIVCQITSDADVSISSCVNNGNVETNNGYAGGIVSAIQAGETKVSMDGCSSEGVLSGDTKAALVAWLSDGAYVEVSNYGSGIDSIGTIKGRGNRFHILFDGEELFVNALSEDAQLKMLYEGKGEMSKKTLDRIIGFYKYVKETRPDWKIDCTTYWKVFTSLYFGEDGWPQCLAEYNKKTFENSADYVTKDEITGFDHTSKHLYVIGK